MRRGRERGSALLEVLVLGLVLIVPLVWLLGVMSELHRAALATNAAAREVGWELARNGSAGTAAAAAAAFADHGLAPSEARLTWSGSPGPDGYVVVQARYPVAIASFPLLGRSSEPVLWMASTQRVHVPAHRSR